MGNGAAIFAFIRRKATFLKSFLPLLLLCMFGNAVFAQNAAIPLDQPVAFCVSALSECTPDNYQPINAPVAYDIRPLNGGKNEPITLVYEVPPPLAGQKNVALLVSPSFRDHCFQLDTQRSQTTCSKRELLTLAIAPDVRKILTQNVQGDDPRIVTPVMLIGGVQELHDVVLRNRTPVLGLAGW